MSDTMGKGMVKTRSGFDSSHLANTQKPRCKEAMKFIAEVVRDLTLLFWWSLPGPATNLRFYCLIFARLVFYILEATAFYAMTATILAGTDTDDPGVLVELTRLLLCSAAEQVEARVRRGTDEWQSLVKQVNGSNSELAEILRNLLHTTTRPSLSTYINNASAAIMELANDTSTLVQTNDTDFPDINSGLTRQSIISEPNDITASTMGFDNGTSIVEQINRMNTSGIDLGPFGNNTSGTLTTNYTLDEDSSAMASFFHQDYRFDFCAQMEDLNSNQTTVACVSGLTGPLCAIFALALGSTVFGFVLARIGQTTAGRRTGGLGREQATDPMHL